jgi:hypothetical protein
MTMTHSPHTAGRAESPRVADMMRRYAEARARLMNGPPKVKHEEVAAIVLDIQEAPLAPVAVEPDTVPLNMLAPCSWRFLLALAAVRAGVSQKDILGVRRLPSIVMARYDAMSLTYVHTQASYPQVAKLFNRDHSTVLHGMRKLGRTKKLVDSLIRHCGGRPLAPGSKSKTDWEVRA